MQQGMLSFIHPNIIAVLPLIVQILSMTHNCYCTDRKIMHSYMTCNALALLMVQFLVIEVFRN
jgi:hypothetical protein